MNDFWLFIENHIEVITGISSIFIAILALGYSIWQAKLMIKHNKLSLRPLITFLTGAIIIVFIWKMEDRVPLS